MWIQRIDLDEEANPEKITVELTTDEAAFIALSLLEQSPNMREEIMPGGAALGADISNFLNGGLFNRFYEDGVNDLVAAARKRHVGDVR
ncbi:hypothetical protein [Streptomyces sp. NPDC059278]|uniref:hypothetical protein n=1 Tax=Streptomyces sp. NPDC059278 TaxID=3346801 RepID=UPI00369D117D